MPRVTHLLVEPYKQDKLVGGHGWTLIIHRVTAVGVTYRAKLQSPEGVFYPCPTRFRWSKSCYPWALKQIRLLRQEAQRTMTARPNEKQAKEAT